MPNAQSKYEAASSRISMRGPHPRLTMKALDAKQLAEQVISFDSITTSTDDSDGVVE